MNNPKGPTRRKCLGHGPLGVIGRFHFKLNLYFKYNIIIINECCNFRQSATLIYMLDSHYLGTLGPYIDTFSLQCRSPIRHAINPQVPNKADAVNKTIRLGVTNSLFFHLKTFNTINRN